MAAILRHFDKVELIRLCLGYDVKTIAEIGVYNGEFSHQLNAILNHPELHLIDPYVEYEDVSIKDCQQVHDARYNMVNLWCKQQNSKGSNITLHRKTSKEAVKSFPDNYFDLVFIDADHSYESVKQDVELWYPKVKLDGVLSGHDCFGCKGVGQTVFEYANKINTTINVALFGDIWFFIKGKIE